MTIKKKLIGYGYTDSNGVATLDYDESGTEISTLAPTGSSGYIGKGVGNVQLEAGLHNSEAVVSEPSNILDCLVYDSGIRGAKNQNVIFDDDYCDEEVGDEYTTFTASNCNSTRGRYKYYTFIDGDFIAEAKVKINGRYNFLMSFGVCNSTANTSYSILNMGAANNYNIFFNDWHIIQIIRQNGIFSARYRALDSSNWISTNLSLDTAGTGTVNPVFYIYNYNQEGSDSLQFSDVKIYSI